MKLSKILKLSIVIIAVFVLVGCNVSKENALNTANEAFEIGVKAVPMEPNKQTGLFEYFLPTNVNIVEEAANNLILSKGDQLFLIFSNPAESQLSQVNYEQDLVLENEALLKETVETDGAFNYILVSPYEDNQYKVIVGNGRDKGTTISTIRDLKNSIETITEVIGSITY